MYLDQPNERFEKDMGMNICLACHKSEVAAQMDTRSEKKIFFR